MNPRIGKRSKYNANIEKPKPKSVLYIELNTKKNLTIKQEYLYLEDVKTAMNIHHLETNIHLKRWVLQNLKPGTDLQVFRDLLEQSIENDRHHLQKKFQISL